ncbi:hypothetical protein OQY15_14205 [Pedobacter sp. MC2016-15]|uniref:hypothetical protein n=1 Tax=Pedobacter sp. MC2016-15 TaxID=2994473 RepID=UPI0022475863|nr:hypothetical protein [Pedobacter sp. MC2016-15]MCX2480249.1 hypothetical protein [Pedobacter sp. MC2016-15]
MKQVNFLGLFLCLLMLSACKKGTNEDPRTAKLLTDSVSYTVNGKKYVSNNIEKGTTLNTQSNTKITSDEYHSYLIKGDEDSLLFVRDFAIKADQSFIILSFIKVYNKDITEFASENNGGWLQYPKNRIDIFAPGMYKYATDYWRNNSISGIAVRIINDKGDYKSYTQWDLTKPASVISADQRDSKFEIISITKREKDYLLEAKFNLTVFNDNKQSQKIENGYLRFSVLKVL